MPYPSIFVCSIILKWLYSLWGESGSTDSISRSDDSLLKPLLSSVSTRSSWPDIVSLDIFNPSLPTQSISSVLLTRVQCGPGCTDGKDVLKLTWVQGVPLNVEIAKILSLFYFCFFLISFTFSIIASAFLLPFSTLLVTVVCEKRLLETLLLDTRWWSYELAVRHLVCSFKDLFLVPLLLEHFCLVFYGEDFWNWECNWERSLILCIIINTSPTLPKLPISPTTPRLKHHPRKTIRFP